MKWEYMSLVFFYSPDDKKHKGHPWLVLSEEGNPRIESIDSYLNLVGEERWEVINLLPERTFTDEGYTEPVIYRALCKRPKVAEPSKKD